MNIKPQPWAMSKPETPKLLPARPNHPFFYKFHPSNWGFQYFTVPKQGSKKKEPEMERLGLFVPNIRMERIVPGVNGIHQIRGELGEAGSRIGRLQQQGWIYLSPQQFDYMHVYPVRGGRYHVPKWLEVRVVANQVIKKMDKESFWKWSCNLLVNHIFPQPEPHFWELQTFSHQKTIDRLAGSQHIPEIKVKINEHYKILGDMKRCIEAYETDGLSIYDRILK
jgi:hypothetical protein